MSYRVGYGIPDVPRLARAERDRAQRGHAPGLPERDALERVHDPQAVLRAEGRCEPRVVRPEGLAARCVARREIKSPCSSSLELTRGMMEYADTTSPEFHGIYSHKGGFVGPRPNPKTHPHLRLEQTMVSMPKVYPGDMVFWHCVRGLPRISPLFISTRLIEAENAGRNPRRRAAAHGQRGLGRDVHPGDTIHRHQRGVRREAARELPLRHRAARLPKDPGRGSLRGRWACRRHRE